MPAEGTGTPGWSGVREVGKRGGGGGGGGGQGGRAPARRPPRLPGARGSGREADARAESRRCGFGGHAALRGCESSRVLRERNPRSDPCRGGRGVPPREAQNGVGAPGALRSAPTSHSFGGNACELPAVFRRARAAPFQARAAGGGEACVGARPLGGGHLSPTRPRSRRLRRSSRRRRMSFPPSRRGSGGPAFGRRRRCRCSFAAAGDRATRRGRLAEPQSHRRGASRRRR